MPGPGDLDLLRDRLTRLPPAADPRRVVLDHTWLDQRHEIFDGIFGARVDLGGEVPLVLLPVRVEVRSTPDQAALRVRIFPDAVHVESLADGLTPEETVAGTTYWEAVWAGADPAGLHTWEVLTAAVGLRRAPWVAEAMRPTNLADRHAAEPIFPVPRGVQRGAERRADAARPVHRPDRAGRRRATDRGRPGHSRRGPGRSHRARPAPARGARRPGPAAAGRRPAVAGRLRGGGDPRPGRDRAAAGPRAGHRAGGGLRRPLLPRRGGERCGPGDAVPRAPVR